MNLLRNTMQETLLLNIDSRKKIANPTPYEAGENNATFCWRLQ